MDTAKQGTAEHIRALNEPRLTYVEAWQASDGRLIRIDWPGFAVDYQRALNEEAADKLSPIMRGAAQIHPKEPEPSPAPHPETWAVWFMRLLIGGTSVPCEVCRQRFIVEPLPDDHKCPKCKESA